MISPEYAAGFFDGEGHVGLTAAGRTRTVALRLAIVNTNAEILELFKLHFGGAVHVRRNGPDHWKLFRSLTLIGYSAADFLHFVRPFVKVKKAQVELALEFWEFAHSKGRLESVVSIHSDGQRRSSNHRTWETIKTEAGFVHTMHELNKRGA